MVSIQTRVSRCASRGWVLLLLLYAIKILVYCPANQKRETRSSVFLNLFKRLPLPFLQRHNDARIVFIFLHHQMISVSSGDVKHCFPPDLAPDKHSAGL